MNGGSTSARRGLSTLVRKLKTRLMGERLRLGTVQGREESWIRQRLNEVVPLLANGEWSTRVEGRAEATERLGEQPLWTRYAAVDG